MIRLASEKVCHPFRRILPRARERTRRQTGDHPLQKPPRNHPKEFAQFIGKQMRLSKIEYAPRAESGPTFNFYMGKNTPERKDYIMDSLVVPVEE